MGARRSADHQRSIAEKPCFELRTECASILRTRAGRQDRHMKALPSLAVATLLLACLPWSNTYAVDPKSDLWRHRFDVENASLNSGNGYADGTDSADLAWGESYVLQAYLTMYQSYGDTAYLDKFKAHVDQIKGHLSDPDGDQFAGWQTSGYAVQKATNRGFEQMDPAAPAAGWVRWQSTPSTAYRTTAAGEVYAGSAALAVKTNPPAGWQVVEQALASYVAGGVYEVSFYGKVANTGPGAAAGRLDIYDATAGQVLATKTFTDTSWSRYPLTFKAPPAGHTVKITCYHDNYAIAGATAFFDEVSVKLRAEYLVHDGMILAPIASFVQIVKQNPQLLAAYLAKANEYQEMLEGVPNTANKGLVTKWWSNTWNEAPPVYLAANDEVFGVAGYLTGTSLPHNQYLPWARLMATLYAVTGKPEYLTRAMELATTFKVNLTPNGNAVRWHYSDQVVVADNGRVPGTEDISHANLDVQAVIDLAQAGIMFGSADLVALRNTLLDVMWLPELNQFALDVVGTQGPTNLDSYTRQGLLRESDHVFNMINLSVASSAVWGRVRSVYQKVENDGFETPSSADATLPDQWQRWQSTAATAFRSTDPAHAFAGKAGLVVKTNPGSGWQALQQQLDLACSLEYRVNFWGKTDGASGVQGRVEVVDETAGTVLKYELFNEATWTYKEFKFISPACPTGPSAFHVVKLYVYQSDHLIPNGTVFVDEINVGIVGGLRLLTLAGLAHWNPERGLNRDFEIVDVADATLPAHWMRWQSQPSTAYRSTASGDALSGKAGLVVKTDPAHGWQIAEQVFAYAPGTQYQVSFDGKTNGVVGGRVEVFDATAGIVLGNAFFSGTSWTHGVFNFTSPSVAGHTVKLTCYHDNWTVAGGKAVFDRVEVTKLP
jgi:hypothetical protein